MSSSRLPRFKVGNSEIETTPPQERLKLSWLRLPWLRDGSAASTCEGSQFGACEQAQCCFQEARGLYTAQKKYVQIVAWLEAVLEIYISSWRWFVSAAACQLIEGDSGSSCCWRMLEMTSSLLASEVAYAAQLPSSPLPELMLLWAVASGTVPAHATEQQYLNLSQHCAPCARKQRLHNTRLSTNPSYPWLSSPSWWAQLPMLLACGQ